MVQDVGTIGTIIQCIIGIFRYFRLFQCLRGLSFFMGGGGDEEGVLGYEKFYPFFVGVRKTLPLFCWGTKNFNALLGYEKFYSVVGI